MIFIKSTLIALGIVLAISLLVISLGKKGYVASPVVSSTSAPNPKRNDSAHWYAPEAATVPVPFVPSPYRGCADCSLPARQLAWSIDHQANQWSKGEFRMSRRGVFLWTANEVYGLTVGNDDNVSPGGFGWKPTEAEKQIIWMAIVDWIDARSLHAKDIRP